MNLPYESSEEEMIHFLTYCKMDWVVKVVKVGFSGNKLHNDPSEVPMSHHKKVSLACKKKPNNPLTCAISHSQTQWLVAAIEYSLLHF